MLWLGFGDLLDFALMTSVFGGASRDCVDRFAKYADACCTMPGMHGLRGCTIRASGIPYGVALAAGALVVFPHTEIFHIATT